MISKFAISKCSQIHLFFLLFIFRILVGRDVAYALSISKDQILMAIKKNLSDLLPDQLYSWYGVVLYM